LPLIFGRFRGLRTLSVGVNRYDIFISGGLKPSDLRELQDVVTGFGVGSYISNAEPVDFSLDIVEIEGENTSKRGKLAGVKEPYRLRDGSTEIVMEGEDQPEPQTSTKLLYPVIENGEKLTDEFSISDAAIRAEENSHLINPQEEK
jgi:nicotinate phosphoribosyltransferase